MKRCSSPPSRAIRSRRADARLIVVPHEPTPDHLGALDRRAAALGLPAPVRLSAGGGPAPLLVVDRVGVLATLYGAGTMAYVGGGFGRAGLHSVLEPAAWGVPVAFGPRWRESRDAGLLLEGGAAAALDDRDAGGRVLGGSGSGGWRTRKGVERQGARAREIVAAGLRRGGAVRRDAGRAYFVTTPSKVTVRGHEEPSGQHREQHVAEPAPHPDLHVRDGRCRRRAAPPAPSAATAA